MRNPNLKSLRIKRNKVGRESRKGRILSNVIEQMRWCEDPESDRSWAQHPTQNLPWIMNLQAEALTDIK